MSRTELEQSVWKLFEDGLSDNEILNEIVTEQGADLTFMDLRILRADYEAEHPESIEEDEPEEKVEEKVEEPGFSIDTITKPGALISGKALLPSGIHIEWILDQMGRVSIIPKGDAKPTAEDMKIFQAELQQELQRRGGMV